jgi:hypothetical protein
MNRERNLGVTEAGVGLALLICLLVVVGYMVLHYLGGTRRAPAVEVLPGVAAPPVPGATDAPPEFDEQPQVLTVESTDIPDHALRTSPEAELR